MCAKTTASVSSNYNENVMWLNGEKVPFDENPRSARCLRESEFFFTFRLEKVVYRNFYFQSKGLLLRKFNRDSHLTGNFTSAPRTISLLQQG